jgi:glucokinase
LTEDWLLADIGGTNARFALAGADLSGAPPVLLTCSDFSTFGEVIDAGIAALGARPMAAALAVAGPVDGDVVSLTNLDWTFSRSALAARHGFKSCRIVNDFAAIAWSLPALGPSQSEPIGDAKAPLPRAPMLALGPGTGLGVSALVPDGDGWVAVAGEGGHASLGTAPGFETQVLAELAVDGSHVSYEDVLSGPGLSRLYHAICRLVGDGVSASTPAPVVAPELVTRMALADPSGNAGRAVSVFCNLLAGYAGDLALIFGARGGVHIVGGVVPKLGKLFDRAAFRHRFEAKGRFESYLSEIPLRLITAEAPGLIGLAEIVRRETVGAG